MVKETELKDVMLQSKGLWKISLQFDLAKLQSFSNKLTVIMTTIKKSRVNPYKTTKDHNNVAIFLENAMASLVNLYCFTHCHC